MILQLLQTFAISMGIGISAQNTNFEHKSRRNETETVGMQINATYQEKGTSYTYTDNYGHSMKVQKYVLKQNDDEPANTIYDHPYLTISNTVYSYIGQTQYGEYRAIQQHVYQITNYYNSTMTVEIEIMMNPASGPTSQNAYRRASLNTNPNAPIDESLTSSTYNTVSTYMNGGNWLIYDQETQSQAYVDITIPQITLAGNTTKTLVISYDRRQSVSNYQNNYPREFILTGNVNIPTQPLEVIDIPSVMFNIMTMPFSFISQAFNLTIFPGTPYQINFSNLFITIISIFILLWLIRHIFK